MKRGKKKKEPFVTCVWGMVCTLSTTDKENNNISLVNIIEQFNFPKRFFKEGKAPVNHEITSLWRKIIGFDDRDLVINFEISLIDPTGKSLAKLVSPLKCDSTHRRTRMRIRVNGLPVTIPGDYVYRISMIPDDGGDPEPVVEIPLDIKEV